MARITYTGIVNSITGSIAGTTFQKNSSGNIARAKSTQVFFPSELQSASRNDFAKVATYWSKLSLSVQQNWNAYAVSHPIYDRWGNLKTLTGFQFYMQSNINLIGLGLEIIPSPPVFVPQDVVPDYSVVAFSNSLHLDFFPAINYPDCDLCLYASAPTTSGSLLNRKNIWFIGSFSSPNAGIFDIKSFYESSFGITWSSFFDSSSCNIVFQCVLVNRVTGIASPFKGFILSIRNYPELVPASFVSGFTDQGSLAGSTGVYNFIRLSTNSILAFSYTSTNCWKSTDEGISWSLLSAIPSTGSIRSSILDVNNNILIAASATIQLLRSTDNGTSWASYGTYPSAYAFISLCKTNSGAIIAGTSGDSSIYRSLDNGLNWTQVLVSGVAGSIYSICELEAGILVASCTVSPNIYRSVDDGATWSLVYTASGITSLSGVAYGGNGIVCIGSTSPANIIRSSDYGLTWSQSGSLFTPGSILNLFYIGKGLFVACTSSAGKLCYSFDYGITWSLSAQLFGASSLQAVFKAANDICLIGSSPSAKVLRSSY